MLVRRCGRIKIGKKTYIINKKHISIYLLYKNKIIMNFDNRSIKLVQVNKSVNVRNISVQYQFECNYDAFKLNKISFLVYVFGKLFQNKLRILKKNCILKYECIFSVNDTYNIEFIYA